MKSFITASAFALFASSALAAPAAADKSALSKRALSAPFNLVLKSDNATYDGMGLVACHIGAAEEAICAYATNATSFYFNASTTYETLPKSVGANETGYLLFDLSNDEIGDNYFPMSLSTMTNTNLAPAVFGAGLASEQEIAFSKKGKMGILSYFDQTVSPPEFNANGTLLTGRWHICEYNFGAYIYNALVWQYGTGPTTTPGCAAVTVHRKFL